MPSNAPIPDYELAERVEVTTPAQLRAMADETGTAIEERYYTGGSFRQERIDPGRRDD